MSAPIGHYMADLAKLLDMHPAPWRCTEPNAVGDFDIVDAAGECVTSCSGGNETYENGLVAAVNLAAGIRP